MPKLKYQDREIHTREGENVLDAMLRQGISIPFSCRTGTCHVCMQRCTSGAVAHDAQRGLRPELRKQGYFMACQCVPLADMEIAPPSGLYAATLAHHKEMLTPEVCRLLIEPPANFKYRPGQFINLRRKDGVTRSYSLASQPDEDYFLELHIQRKNDGVMSNWIMDELNAGDELDIQGADGECCYNDETHSHPLLLVGTGTGLAPLTGILRDAMHNAHEGEIHLYHGGRDSSSFYLHETLRAMERRHANFHYHECLSGNLTPPEGVLAGRAHALAFARHHDLRGWHVYLAGQPEMVASAELLAAKCGAAPSKIHADAFELRELRSDNRDGSPHAAAPTDKGKYPPPDPELWKALREGESLSAVLTDFYARLFRDAKLGKFFDGMTERRLVEKQYLFVRQILTGEKIYFGDRPRNTHHWMVISDELFDYREGIMVDCLRQHGLSEEMIIRFRAMEEFYRSDIVKAAPFARTLGDIERPYEGFDEITMDVGSLCDACEREVSVGEKVIYHVRMGKIYCFDCSAQHHHELPA